MEETVRDNNISGYDDKKGKVKRKNNRNTVYILAITAVLAIIAVVVIFVSRSIMEKNYAEQLALGDKYLNEMDYDKAIAAYKSAIDIKQTGIEAYSGLVDVYLTWAGAQENNAAASGALNEGLSELEKIEEEYTEASIIVEEQRIRIQMKLVEISDKELEDEAEHEDEISENENIPEKDYLTVLSDELCEEIWLELYCNNEGYYERPGALFITLEERKAYYRPISEKLEEYIFEYKNKYGTANIDCGKEVNENYVLSGIYDYEREGILLISCAYDYLNFCYRQMEDMEEAWKWRCEQAELAGKKELLNGFLESTLT